MPHHGPEHRFAAQRAARLDRWLALGFASLLLVSDAYTYVAKFHPDVDAIRFGDFVLRSYTLNAGLYGLIGGTLLVVILWRGATRLENDVLALAVVVLGFGLWLVIREQIALGQQVGALNTMGEVLIAALLGSVVNAVLKGKT